MIKKDKLTIAHREEIERAYEKWLLVRKSLGIESFGVNIVELPPGGDIPEHDETERDQEELFIVLEGEPTMIIDGKEYETKPMTFIRLDVEPKRTMVNNSKKTAAVLILSAPRGSGYKPMDWA